MHHSRGSASCFAGIAGQTARCAQNYWLLITHEKEASACCGMRGMAHEAVHKPLLMKEAHMFEHLNTPEELFSYKLGSALKMEQELVNVLEVFEARTQRPEIKQALSQHREETLQHARNIESVRAPRSRSG